MDPMLAAALYGPLPGAGGGGGGAPPASASSQGRMHSAESLTHNIGAEASSLKAENDAMEQRLQALTDALGATLEPYWGEMGRAEAAAEEDPLESHDEL